MGTNTAAATVITFSAYDPDAAPETVRLYAALVLEIRTFGYRSANSELTVAAMAAADAVKAQPSRPARSRALAASTAARPTALSTVSDHAAKPSDAAMATRQNRRPATRARSRTGPSVLSARNVAPCRMDSESSVIPVQTP